MSLPSSSEHRQHDRAPCRIPGGAEGPRGPVRGTCTNLSPGGLFLEGAQLPSGAMISVFLDHPALGHFKALAEVRHLSASPRGMGVQFTRLEPGQEALLQRILGTLRR